MNKSFVAILLATILLFSVNAQAGSDYSKDIERAINVLKNASNSSKGTVSNKYYYQRLTSLMKENGFHRVNLKSKNQAITFESDGRKLVLFIKKNGDLQLFFAISGGKWSHRTINDWNRENRLSRAYLDKDDEPVLESDLMSSTGLSDEQITAFVQYFTETSMNRFRRFLIEKSQGYERSSRDYKDESYNNYSDRYDDDSFDDERRNSRR